MMRVWSDSGRGQIPKVLRLGTKLEVCPYFCWYAEGPCMDPDPPPKSQMCRNDLLHIGWRDLQVAGCNHLDTASPHVAQRMSPDRGSKAAACRETEHRHLSLGVHSWNILFFFFFFFVVSSFCENLDDKEKDVFGFLKRDVPDVTHKQCTDTYREHPLILLQPPLHFQSPCWWKTSTIHLSCPSTPQASYSCGNKRNLSLITLKINDDMAKVEVDICRSVGTRLKRWLFANH